MGHMLALSLSNLLIPSEKKGVCVCERERGKETERKKRS